MKEYDLINELGSQNWLDIVAGEAVVLGHLFHDAELVMRGTSLAAKLTEVHFDDDNFPKVEAEALSLLKVLDRAKKFREETVFLDEICEYEGGNRSLNKWEYDLILAKGVYQIQMYMPEYFGERPSDEYLSVEAVIRESYGDFGKFQRCDKSQEYGGQKMDTTDYYTNDGRLVCRRTDFTHECGWKNGVSINYYIDDALQAVETWAKIRAILGRRK